MYNIFAQRKALRRDYGLVYQAMARAWWMFGVDNVVPAVGGLVVVRWSADDVYMIGRATQEGVDWCSVDGGSLPFEALECDRAEWRYFYD